MQCRVAQGIDFFVAACVFFLVTFYVSVGSVVRGPRNSRDSLRFSSRVPQKHDWDCNFKHLITSALRIGFKTIKQLAPPLLNHFKVQ